AQQRGEDVRLRARAVDAGDGVAQRPHGAPPGARSQLPLGGGGQILVRKVGRRQRGSEFLQPPLDLFVAGAQALGDLLTQLGESALDRGADLAVQLVDSFRKGHPLLSAAVLCVSSTDYGKLIILDPPRGVKEK